MAHGNALADVVPSFAYRRDHDIPLIFRHRYIVAWDFPVFAHSGSLEQWANHQCRKSAQGQS